MATLQDYRDIVGLEPIEELRVIAGRVADWSCHHINSTPVGGDAAEALTRLVPLMRELGIDTTWDVIKGDQQFLSLTETLIQALQGKPELISEAMMTNYRSVMEENLGELRLERDVVFIHDPKPTGLIACRHKERQRWVWQPYMDLSHPDEAVWRLWHPYVEQYNASIFAAPEFAPRVSIPQYVIPPSIDPLSDRNRELNEDQVRTTLEQHGIDPDRPIMLQGACLDRGTDAAGAISVFRLIRPHQDCQLVLAGEAAADDPDNGEQTKAVEDLQAQAAGDPDIRILALPPFSGLAVNALVRGATLVLHQRLRDGLGSAVSEAMWKRKPVVGRAAAGIRRQIVSGYTGFLVHSVDRAAQCAAQLLADPEMCRRMGENAHWHVCNNYLLIRQLKDYLLLMLALEHRDRDVVFLA